MDGFDRAGVSFQNLSREYYDDELYDAFGHDVYGFTRAGLDFEGRDLEGYDLDGYDSRGFDRSGLDVENYDVQGRDRWGFNRFGWDWRGFSCHHRDSNDQPDRGYIVGADGNVREETEEGPSAEVMDCDHRTVFVRASATCFVCKWRSDIFYQLCSLCSGKLCRACDRAGVERQRTIVRQQYLWPGSDSFGIDGMYERAEESLSFEEPRTVEFIAPPNV